MTSKSSRDGLACRVIGLGDYLDRGPASAAVLEFLAGLRADGRRAFTWLKGNHEEMFLSFLDAPESFGPGWVDFGGLETLFSYGARFPELPGRLDFRSLRDALAARLPIKHLLFLQRLEISFTRR